jgi:CelD/BcsL family acetyltransferase involved in cellulose biosynthesis
LRLQSADGVYSPYQSHDWVRLWYEHVSRGQGRTPRIVVGYDASGEPSFLWPLETRRRGPLSVASFFGGSHASLNFMPWRADVARRVTREDLDSVLASLASQCPDLDLLVLSGQAAGWRGIPNPFALLPFERSSEENVVLTIDAPPGEIVERCVSSSKRAQLRRRERKLARLHGYRHVRLTDPAAVRTALDIFLAQKAAKLARMGVPNTFSEPGVEAFLREACTQGLADHRALITVDVLEGGGEQLAIIAGLEDGVRYTANFLSYTTSDHSRQSPGLILMQHIIRNCAGRGITSFDMGPGEADYKRVFCREPEMVFDSVVPISARGKILAGPIRGLLRLRTAIKRHPAMSRVARRARAVLLGLRPATTPTRDGDGATP